MSSQTQLPRFRHPDVAFYFQYGIRPDEVDELKRDWEESTKTGQSFKDFLRAFDAGMVEFTSEGGGCTRERSMIPVLYGTGNTADLSES